MEVPRMQRIVKKHKDEAAAAQGALGESHRTGFQLGIREVR